MKMTFSIKFAADIFVPSDFSSQENICHTLDYLMSRGKDTTLQYYCQKKIHKIDTVTHHPKILFPTTYLYPHSQPV